MGLTPLILLYEREAERGDGDRERVGDELSYSDNCRIQRQTRDNKPTRNHRHTLWITMGDVKIINFLSHDFDKVNILQ